MEQILDLDIYENRQVVIEKIFHAADGSVSLILNGLRTQDDPANEDLARDLYAVARKIGLSSDKLTERQLCVEYLLEKAHESSGYLKNLALQFLGEFRHNDFSKQAHNQIIELYGDEFESSLLKVTGIAEVLELKATVSRIAASSFVNQSAALKVDPAWNATLALARMGDDASATRLVERVKSELDIVIRATLLFRDLGYTLHPISYQALASSLDSVERLPTLKASQQQGSREAAAAADEIAAHLDGAPDILMLGEDEKVLKIKQWLAAQDELRFIR